MAAGGPTEGRGQAGNGRKTREIKIRLPEQLAPGVYANAMLVQHTREEFVMDFGLVVGGGGTVVARVLTSPGHMKRIVSALEDNLKKYEALHGPIKMPPSQPPLTLGFHPPGGADN